MTSTGAYRERAGLTQRDLAQRLLLHQSAIPTIDVDTADGHVPDLATLVAQIRSAAQRGGAMLDCGEAAR